MFSHATSITVADALRIVTVVELGFVAGLSIAVMSIYFLANKHIGRVDQTRGGSLMRYVIGIAGSYTLLAAFGIAEIQGFYGSVLTYRAPIGFAAGLLGIYSMLNMLIFQDNRLSQRDDKIQIGGTPDV